MKKFLLSMAFLAATFLSLPAQEIRTNYRLEGMTHISTDYERLDAGADPVWTRVELVGFPDGSSMYLLYLNIESKKAFTVPKGVKMTATLPGGRVVRADQIGRDNPTKTAYEDGKRRFYWNRLKYALESADMEKLVRGVKSLEITTGWGPDDFIQYSFKEDDAFGSLLKRHCEAILHAADSTLELSAEIAGRTESKSSIMTASKPIVATGAQRMYNVLLSHLYYKNTNAEDVDLAFNIGSEEAYHVPFDVLIDFTLEDGSVISLKQTRDEDNFIYLFPSLEELRRLAAGITAISIPYEGGTLTDTFPDAANGFSAAIAQQLNLLLSLSPR